MGVQPPPVLSWNSSVHQWVQEARRIVTVTYKHLPIPLGEHAGSVQEVADSDAVSKGPELVCIALHR